MKARITLPLAVITLAVLSLFVVGCGGEQKTEGPVKLEVVHFDRLRGLPEDNITAMAAFANKIWAGSKKGLFTYDGVNWQIFVRENTNVLGSNIIEDLKVQDNAIWIATDNGVAKFDGRNWSSVYTGGRARSAVGSGGALAIATARGIEYASVGSVFSTMCKETAGLVYDEVNQVVYDGNNQLWVGTRAGVARLTSGMFQNYTGPAKSVMGSSLIDIPAKPASCQLIGNNVKVMMPYRNMLAIGTTSGLSITDMQGTWNNYIAPHNDWFQRGNKIVEERVNGNSPLPANVINSLATTSDYELLFVGTTRGLGVLRNNNWVDISTMLADVPQVAINGLAVLDNDLWVGTEQGIYQVKDITQLLKPAEK